jgi:cytochrome c-type protein NapC
MSDDKKSRNPLFAGGVIAAAVLFLLGAAFAGVFGTTLDLTNSTAFCTSCHSMKQNLAELQEKPHWKSKSGVHAGCADCHVPKSFGPKMVAKVMAAKDVYHEIMGTIGTPEKFEAHRLEMAKAVWAKMKASDSRECKSCHSFDHMKTADQDKMARKKHENAVARGQTCIDCHKGIAHKLPPGAEDATDEK